MRFLHTLDSYRLKDMSRELEKAAREARMRKEQSKPQDNGQVSIRDAQRR